MNHAIEFVETSIFTKQIKALATDDELRAIQAELIAHPLKGDLITGTGGLRKVRMAVNRQGKSSGVRVIYFLNNVEKIYLILAYHKNQKVTLSNTEKLELKKWVQQLKGEKI
jgi:hypothetical protein